MSGTIFVVSSPSENLGELKTAFEGMYFPSDFSISPMSLRNGFARGTVVLESFTISATSSLPTGLRDSPLTAA